MTAQRCVCKQLQGPPDWHPAPDSVKAAAREAVAAAKSHVSQRIDKCQVGLAEFTCSAALLSGLLVGTISGCIPRASC